MEKNLPAFLQGKNLSNLQVVFFHSSLLLSTLSRNRLLMDLKVNALTIGKTTAVGLGYV